MKIISALPLALRVWACTCVAASLGLSEMPHAAAQTWKPDKPVEIIAVNAPGGGSDRIARIMAKVLQEGVREVDPQGLAEPGPAFWWHERGS